MSIAPTQPQTAAALPRTRIRLEPEVRKQLILDAALAEFSAHGFTATRIDDIAKRAGLSKGGFYAHYPSKEEVFSALLASSVAIEDLDVEGIINQCNTAREFAECVVNSLYTALQQPRTMAVLHLLLTNAQHLPEAAAEWQRNTFESTCAQLTQLCSAAVKKGICRDSIVCRKTWLILSPLVHQGTHLMTFYTTNKRPLQQALSDHIELLCELLEPRWYSPHLGRCLKVEAMPPWLTSGSA